MSDPIEPPGDRKVARMARRCKGKRAPFPTFGAQIGQKNISRRPNSGLPEFGFIDGKGREKNSFLQLALQRLHLFGQRHVLGYQGLDLAHGVQHRRVITSAEAAANLGQ